MTHPDRTDRSELRSDCLIIGGGQAGGWVAAGLRRKGFAGTIALVGDEPYPPYERPPLSKRVLTGEDPVEATYLNPADFYGANGIDLVLGRRVVALDPGKRWVTTDDGAGFRFGRLVLATGARPRHLMIAGAEIPGVHYLRGIADMLAIRSRISAATRLVIVGGGFIGLEVAASAVRLGAKVTVLEAEDALLKRTTPPSVALAVQRLHERHGVAFQFDVRLAAVEGTGDVKAITLEGGETIAADLMIGGIGATPNVEIAVSGGLAVDNGILVDAYGRTSAPDIFAAGDVTNHFNPLLGRHVRLECWQNAQNQALAIAGVLCGEDTPYAEVPWFWSDQYDLNLQYAGQPTPLSEEVVRGDPDSGAFSIFSIADGRVAAVCGFGTAKDVAIGKRLIAAKQFVDPVKLRDSSVDLRRLLAR
jgi:3-phenylpropionate/trans-cinnamate dioxygenase ferredoxin reductase subunit